MGRRRALQAAVAVVVLTASGLFLVLDHQRLDSATMDEPFHSLASAEYVLSGTYWGNLEHPPLTKLLAGACLGAAGARAPRIPVPFSFATAETPARFCTTNTIPAGELLAAARRPFPILFVLLVGTAAAWTGLRLGPAAAAAVGLLLAFEPNLVAHAAYLHTDVAAALGFFGTLVAFLAALEGRSLLRWAGAGVVLGLALAAKFSAVFLVPILLLLALLHALAHRERDVSGARRPPDLRPLAGLCLAGLVAAVVLLGSYAIALRSMSHADAETAVRLFLRGRHAAPETVEAIARVSRVLPPAGHYLAGLAGIAAQNRIGGGVCVLRGEVSVDGFWDYFLVAFGVKSSLGLLLLVASAGGLVLWRRHRPGFAALTLAAPVVYLFASSTVTSYNIGVRHLLPVYPLLAVLSVGAVTRLLPGRRGHVLLVFLGLLQAGETILVHPHEISFFNAAAGGPSSGERWLNDSNLDWGQDLARLARELERHGEAGSVTIAYFGGASPLTYLPRARLFDAAATPITPGLYAVSSFLLAAGPELMAFRGDVARATGYERLRQAIRRTGTPVGRVGYSIRIYRLP